MTRRLTGLQSPPKRERRAFRLCANAAVKGNPPAQGGSLFALCCSSRPGVRQAEALRTGLGSGNPLSPPPWHLFWVRGLPASTRHRNPTRSPVPASGHRRVRAVQQPDLDLSDDTKSGQFQRAMRQAVAAAFHEASRQSGSNPARFGEPSFSGETSHRGGTVTRAPDFLGRDGGMMQMNLGRGVVGSIIAPTIRGGVLGETEGRSLGTESSGKSSSEMILSNNNSLRIRAQAERLQVHVERLVGPLPERRQRWDRRAVKRAFLRGRRETD